MERTSLDPFFETLEVPMIDRDPYFRGLYEFIKFYNEVDTGRQRRGLLEWERSELLREYKCHNKVDGKQYHRAINDDDLLQRIISSCDDHLRRKASSSDGHLRRKVSSPDDLLRRKVSSSENLKRRRVSSSDDHLRRKVFSPENKSGEESTLHSQSRLSTRNAESPTTRPSHRPALSPDFPTIRRRVLIDTLFDIVGAVTVQKEEVVTVQEASALGPDFPTTHRVPLGTHFDIEEAVTVQKASALNPDFPTIHRVPLGTPFDTEEVVTVQKASALTPLNQLEIWMVGDVDMLSKFNNFKHQQPQSRFSLALDGIADVSPGSEFSQTLSQEERALANVISVKDLDEKWPSLSSILSRVCAASRSYDDVVKALRKENTNEPIVDYLRDITYRYSHYLKFSDQVPRNINEREGFGDLTWPFIRGALTLANIPSRCFEIPVAGTKERKNFGRDLLVQTEEQALMADGVALFRDHQIYLAEASLIYEPKLDKEVKDKFKVVRCMRDSWNSQIKSITREAVPPLGLTVFGSTSFGDETKFYAMDFVGTYRLKQVGRMLVPLDKAHFASRMEICVRNCLRFALELQEEVERRTHLVSTSQDLTAACDTIMQTRTTPTKEVKKRRMSGHTTTAPSDPTED